MQMKMHYTMVVYQFEKLFEQDNLLIFYKYIIKIHIHEYILQIWKKIMLSQLLPT